jgi:suppressor of ftsI
VVSPWWALPIFFMSAVAQAQHGSADSGMAGMIMPSQNGHRMPAMPRGTAMMPGMDGLAPGVTPFMPRAADVDGVPSKIVELKDGDTLDLDARVIRRRIGSATYNMYGFNGQYPGPLVRVHQNATIVVRFTNHIDLPSAVHWHGVRLDNKYDGVVGLTQAAVAPGGTFVYQVHFPDAGVYWYHPHVREDVEQNLGLFGDLLVAPADSAYYNPVNAEGVLMLHDLLVDGHGIIPYGTEGADFAIMGRIGNVLLVNGEPRYHLAVHRGDVVRFYLTNASSARSYNLSFAGTPTKLVAADLSRFEREQMVDNVVIAPAQRFIVETRFDTPGVVPILNRVQAVNNYAGEYFAEVDTLGTIDVAPTPTAADHGAAFKTLKAYKPLAADIDRFRPMFGKPVDHRLTLTVNIQGMPNSIVAFMTIDTMYFNPVEWNDGMPDMNWISTAREVRWILRDDATKKENMDIDWRAKKGDVLKIAIHNDENSMHPMGHPIHFHGQRFLVLTRDGVANPNLAWQDTDLIPVGSTDVLLLDASNPGRWMAHCHIAEHLESGMMMSFTVDP